MQLSLSIPMCYNGCKQKYSITTITAPSGTELEGLFQSLAACSTKPPILSLVEGHSHQYVPSPLATDLPCILTSMWDTMIYSRQLAVLVVNMTSVKKMHRKSASCGCLSSRRQPEWLLLLVPDNIPSSKAVQSTASYPGAGKRSVWHWRSEFYESKGIVPGESRLPGAHLHSL